MAGLFEEPATSISEQDELRGDGHPSEWVERLCISFIGEPQQRGSKHAMVQKLWHKGGDRSIVWRKGTPVECERQPDGSWKVWGDPAVLMTDSNRDSSAYMAKLIKYLRAQWNSREPLEGAVRIEVKFYFARPKSHYGTGKNAGRLKPSAPREYLGTPDLDKLTRTVADCLTQSGVIVDDKQIARYGEEHGRYYSDDGAEYLVLRVDSRPDEQGGGAW